MYNTSICTYSSPRIKISQFHDKNIHFLEFADKKEYLKNENFARNALLFLFFFLLHIILTTVVIFITDHLC